MRAAGVEMWMSVTVANYGDAPARGVTVQLEQDGDALPALVLDDIPPRDELTHKFRVQFAGTGAHWLSASLAADAVAVDNRRYFACDLPAGPAGADRRRLAGRPRRASAFARARAGRQHADRLAAARRAGQLSGRCRTAAASRRPFACSMCRGWPTTSWRRWRSTSATAAAWPFFVGPNTDRGFLQRSAVPQRRGPVSRAAQAADAAPGPRGRSHARRGSDRRIRCFTCSPAAATASCRCSWSTTTMRSPTIGRRRRTARPA